MTSAPPENGAEAFVAALPDICGGGGECDAVSLSLPLVGVDSTDENGEAENSRWWRCARVRATSAELITTSSYVSELDARTCAGAEVAAAGAPAASRSVCSDRSALALSRRARRAARRISHDGRGSGESGVALACAAAVAAEAGGLYAMTRMFDAEPRRGASDVAVAVEDAAEGCGCST